MAQLNGGGAKENAGRPSSRSSVVSASQVMIEGEMGAQLEEQ